MTSTCVLLQAGSQFCCPGVWYSSSRCLVLLFPVPGTPVPGIRYSCSQCLVLQFPASGILVLNCQSGTFHSSLSSEPKVCPYSLVAHELLAQPHIPILHLII